MSKWSDRRAAKIDALVEKAVSSAFESSPLGTLAPGGLQVQAAPSAASIQALSGLPGNQSGVSPTMARLLGRGGDQFSGGMGPGFPIGFMPLDDLQSNGRPNPRRYQYEIAWNLNLEEHLAQWNVLAAAAVQIDLFARAISIRSGDVTKMDWAWTITQDAINTITQANNCSTSEAAKIARTQFMPEITRLSEFWENPYPQSDRSWEEWITEGLWQVLVYDGWPVHPQMNLAGQVIGFETIDASTIKVLLDNEGGTPRPPDVAFQQILYGFPRGEFLASPDKDAPTYFGGEFQIDDRDQLSYFVMNRRTRSPYGLSPLESSLPIAKVYVERLRWMTDDYLFGSSAKGYIESSAGQITDQNIQDYNRAFNAFFQGSSANRQTLWTLPEGFKAPAWMPQIDEKFKADYDEMWIKRIAAHFGVQPSQFGVVAKAGLGGGKGASEGEADMTETVSSKPQNKYLERVVNALSRRHLNAPRGISFSLIDDEGSEDEVEQSTALKNYWSFGALTANEVREELGKSRFTFPDADMPFITLATALLPLEGASEPPTEAPSDNQDEGDQSQEPEVEEDPSEGGGEASETDVDEPTAKAEMATFLKYVKRCHKSGKWRSFEFASVNDEIAERLNERAYFIVKGVASDDKGWADEILKAGLAPRPKSWSKRKKEDLHNFPHVKRIADEHKAAIAAGLSGAAGVGAAIRAALDGEDVADAVLANVTFPTAVLVGKLTALYQDAGDAGAGQSATGARLQELLDQAGITINGVEGTTRDRVTTAIADGVNAGESASQIAARVQASALGDMANSQAGTIAETEANRAYNAGYMDAAQDAGVTEFNWVAYDTACQTCQDNEDGSPYSADELPDFPAHPNCMCTTESVI